MKKEMIMNNADSVVADLVADDNSPQDANMLSPRMQTSMTQAMTSN